MKWLTYPLFVVFLVMTLVAQQRQQGQAQPKACEAAFKTTMSGTYAYCPTTPCTPQNECNENEEDSLFWCACGVGGPQNGPCNGVWTENEDGTYGTMTCINNNCSGRCTPNEPPASGTGFACSCGS